MGHLASVVEVLQARDEARDGDGAFPVGRPGGSRRGEPPAEVEGIGEAEHLTRDLARVRAKFAMDPLLAPRSLDAAWMTDAVMEEDEAEFVDTVADCLGAGLSLDDALTCWDTGDLATATLDDAHSDGDNDDDGPPLVLAVARTFTPGAGPHRVFVR